MFKHETVHLEPLVSETLPEGRFYTTPAGQRYPSVTTVIGRWSDKKFLEEWRRAVGPAESERISEFARRRGGRMHAFIESHLMNRDCPYRPNFIERASLAGVTRVLDARVGTVFGVECPLYSDRLRTAGRADAVTEFDGLCTVLDFKTSRDLKYEKGIPGYFLQAATYGTMFTELTGRPVEQLVVLIAIDHDDPSVFIQRMDRWAASVNFIFSRS